MSYVNFENGMMNYGDPTRIKRAMAKAMKGGEITVGFLGGSITQGCLSSTPETCYAYLVYEWWKNTFKNAKVNYVNAGIGGTPSNFGVARADDDLLGYRPDFTIVEFSVNDDNTEYFLETYEGLVRHILKDKCGTGLMLLHNVRYDNRENAEDRHLFIGKYYGLPCVSMKHSVYPEIANGSIERRDITPDDLHPNDAGHRLICELVVRMLEKIKSEVTLEDADAYISTELRPPVTRNGYEHSVRLQNTNYKAESAGFEEDMTPQEYIMQMFRHGYTAWHAGDRITFMAEGSGIAIQYRKTISRPTPVARVVIDGDAAHAVILDGNFKEDWGDCLYTEQVLTHGECRMHTVEIEIIEDHADKEEKDKVPFYLVSVIAQATE